ncbi:hypothetical protein GQ42DRAFT_58653 [Ramicandelaber brevisporus]|nr:hypothetical protein GQ42DRAFT_58653 [Ramicandelaber brevisporus]
MFAKPSSLLAAAAALAAVASNVAAHMIVAEPCVQGSTLPGCAAIPGNAPDYDLSAPISTNDRIGAPICKNPNRFQRAYKTYKAGGSIPVTLSGGAPHGGGHCQFSVSYDGGQTFVVLRTVMTECMKNGQNSWDVPIPASAPSSDNVLFQWTWNNAIGNREMYSLCSRIGIDGQQSSGSITGPKVLYANHGAGSPYIGDSRSATTAARRLWCCARS